MHCWGWATWRSAWKRFDYQMQSSSKIIDRQLKKVCGAGREEQQFWREMFEAMRTGYLNTWDWRWQRSIWAHSGLCIIPRENLVSNVGFDSRTTHTTTGSHPVSSTVSTVPYCREDFPSVFDQRVDSIIAEKLNLKRPVPPGLLRRIARRMKAACR